MSVNGTSLPGPDNITRVELDNGIVVLVYENFVAQSVVFTGSLRTGSLYETPAQSGLASMTAGSLMRGTQQRDFDAIHSTLEDIGADVDVGAGTHGSSFSGKSLAEDLPVLIDILSDVLRYPSFPAAQVERLRGEIMTGLQYRQQDTRYRANRAFRENLYPDNHPYHYSTRGTLETIPTLTVSDMEAFHRSTYGPAGMVITIVGAVKAQQAIDIVQAKFGDWKNPDQPALIELPTLPSIEETRRISVNVSGKTQSDLIMGVPGPSRLADDYRAATMANSILGQFGMMGRIGDEVREKQGLAYYAGSSVDGGHGPNPWSVSAGVNPSNVQKAIDSIIIELRRIISEPVSDEDLSDNKSYFIGHLPLQLESNEGVAASIQHMETYQLGLDNLLKFRDRVNALTKEDLLAAAQHYLNPDALVISVAGPE